MPEHQGPAVHDLRPRLVLLVVLLALACPLAGGGGEARARALAEDEVLLLADEVVYDRRLGIVTATGSVELARGERLLRADTLSYNKRSDVVTASGNVALLEPSGEVVFADYVELTGDLKSGAVHGFGMLLTDGSRLAAAGGRLTADGRSELAKVVYSPCRLCEDDPERAPLWQLKAVRVVHDRELQTIFYTDATLEVYGIPVLYVPFFSHPDPTVERKTGFLPPVVGRNSTLGLTYTQPYFFNISDSRDATVTPIFTSKEGPVLTAEYREATRSGSYQIEGSITRGDRLSDDSRTNKRTRGHVNGFGDFEINPYWATGFAIARSSDATYLARYGFARGRPSLTQNVYLEGRRGREHARIDAFYFQSLDPDIDGDTVPWILPLFDYGWRSEPGIVGGVWAFDTNARVLGRPDGADSRRLSLSLGWNLPHVSPAGEVYRLRLSLRGDAYHVSDVTDPQSPTGPTLEGFTGRVVPRIELGWRWPWVRESGGTRLVVEPVVQLIASPNGGNPKEIPNEDSLSFEFDDANLLSANRFPGLDRVEGGVRANYAVRLAAYGSGGGWSEFLFGQSWRLQDDDTFETGTGLSQHFSDYVGRLTVAPGPLLDLGLRFRLDKGNLAPRRLSLSVGGGPQWLRGQLSYINLSDEPTAGVPSTVEQLNLSGVYRFAERWSLSARHQRDLGKPGGSLLTGIGLTYADECITISIQADRNFTRELDVEDTTNVSVMVRLRNLG